MKLIFLDADGTLFHHEGYIPDSAIKACIQAQKNGHKVILCTGRQRIEIFGPMLEIEKKMHSQKKKANVFQTTFLQTTSQLTLKAAQASMPLNIQKTQC